MHAGHQSLPEESSIRVARLHSSQRIETFPVPRSRWVRDFRILSIQTKWLENLVVLSNTLRVCVCVSCVPQRHSESHSRWFFVVVLLCVKLIFSR